MSPFQISRRRLVLFWRILSTVLITREGSRNCFECSVFYIFDALSERPTSSDRPFPSLHCEIEVNRRLAREAEVSASRVVLCVAEFRRRFTSENKLRL
jgi:hypothetical protein